MAEKASRIFTTKYSNLVNVLRTPVKVGTPILGNPASTDPRTLNPGDYTAIWDTGATHCVISSRVIQECQLKPVGIVKVCHAGGESLCEQFLVSIFLPNMVIIPAARVTYGDIRGADILIGMDIIGKGDFAVSNYCNQTCMTFRIPSLEMIDFLRLPNSRLITPVKHKVGRNDPCPCGSGKKYKHCCGSE